MIDLVIQLRIKKVNSITWPRKLICLSERVPSKTETLSAGATEESAAILEKCPALFCHKFISLQTLMPGY